MITTFINPNPAVNDYFAWAVSAVGTYRVLIGAYQDNTGAFRAGAAYLFSTNGTLRVASVSVREGLLENWVGWAPWITLRSTE